MKTTQLKSLAAALAALALSSAQAALVISEVAPYASGNTPFAADWFELTNTGPTALTVDGWKVDDNSNSFAASLTLNGIASIAAGQSVVYLETTSAATVSAFRDYWGAPVDGVAIGTYSGAGIGLSTGGDAVNIFDKAGTVLARVTFGASTAGRSFDNAAGANNAALGTLSVVGVNGAFKSLQFLSASTTLDVGSPGRIATPVPEPQTYALFAAGLLAIGGVLRRRQR